ncbi:DUF3592 domain-containing protein [Hymenobacter sp. BT730]|uniref:DUF3592 domain-containing protein n=1 Tax=Hymenobacter sp. BT730 TaxID=3063332 RepID=UPI0034A3CAC5
MPFKETARWTLLFLITIPTSCVLLFTFILGNYSSWVTSQGPSATAIVLAKRDSVPSRAMTRDYRVRVVFQIENTRSVIADAEVNSNTYSSLHINDRVNLHYDAKQPIKVALSSEAWFHWNSLAVLLLGLVLLLPIATAKHYIRK